MDIPARVVSGVNLVISQVTSVIKLQDSVSVHLTWKDPIVKSVSQTGGALIHLEDVSFVTAVWRALNHSNVTPRRVSVIACMVTKV